MKNFFLEIFTWWSSQTLGTRIYTLLNGKFVGTDADGNKYYLNKKNGQNRWVIYNGQIREQMKYLKMKLRKNRGIKNMK